MSRAAAALALLVLAAPARAGRWADLAARVGASEQDLGIRPDRFETQLTLPAVERLLDDPASGYDESLSWGERLSSAPALSGPLALAAELLSSTAAFRGQSAAAQPEPFSCPGLPGALTAPVAELARAVTRAQAQAARLSAVFTGEERARLLASFGGMARHEPLAAVTEEDAALAARFDARAAAAAGAALAGRVEAELPALSAAAAGAPRGRWRCGPVLVGGPGDDAYAAADLQGVSLLVDLGGRDRYDGPAAAAGPGEARVVVDLGSALTLTSTAPAYGSGVFGIGLFYAPSAGRKTVEAGDFSLGAGFFGAGGALLAGDGLQARSGHFSQGAGAFGAGAFVVSGASASLTADYAGQGFGFTRGAGLFAARGPGLRADCGLRHPDARDPQALLSLCQGVGEGPRAHAAGGIGLALVDGGRAALRASYFAQGAGYWHAFGGLYARGDGSFAQARRYAQGAGVHAGAGLLSWRGSDGRVLTWGVGPAFGWDYGVGMLSLRGDRDALRADWASGSGDADGRSLAEIDGVGNALRLPDWGLATYKRAAAGYALSRVRGRGTRLSSPGSGGERSGALDAAITPWGVARLEDGASLSPDVEVASAPWPAVDRGADAAEDARADAAALARADALPAGPRVARWLWIAAGESLDSGAAASAAARLLTLPRAQASDVVRAMSVGAFDEALWARLASAAAAPEAAREAAEELPRERGLRRALLVDVLRYAGARAVIGPAEALLKDRDWRLRRSGAAQLGLTFGSEGGEEPGRLRFLETSLSLCRSTFTAGSPEESAAFAALGAKRLLDLYPVLALDTALGARERLALLWASGSPFDTVPPAALRVYVEVLRRGAGVYEPALRRELARTRELRPRARRSLRAALHDPDPDVRAAVFVALGEAGTAEDAPRLGAALSDPASVARQAAAAGLGRLGAEAREELLGRLSDRAASVRRLGVLAAAQSGDGAVVSLLRRGLADPDAGVRLAAVAALSLVQAPFARQARREAAPELDRLAAGDPDPSVAASAARQLGRLGRD